MASVMQFADMSACNGADHLLSDIMLLRQHAQVTLHAREQQGQLLDNAKMHDTCRQQKNDSPHR